MSVWRTARATAWSSLAAISAQAIAALTLDAGSFGVFSLWMLGFGLCSSLSLSLVSEPWTRDGRRDDWAAYATPLVWLSAGAGLVGCVVAIATSSTAGIALALAIGLSTYRLGARFHALVSGDLRHVEPADVAACCTTVVVWLGASRVVDPLHAVALAWCAGAAASVALSRRPRLVRGGLGTWARGHARSIRALLADGALLDANAIGVPLAIAPALGLGGFGVFRAPSSAAVPVRLALSPLRPLTAAAPLARSMRPGIVGLLCAGGLVGGLGVGGALVALDASGLVAGTVVADLSAHAPAVAAFLAVSMPLFHAQMAARTHLRSRALLAFRAASLVVGLAAPLAGSWALGLPGALWGAVAASAIDGVVVHALLWRTLARARRAVAS